MSELSVIKIGQTGKSIKIRPAGSKYNGCKINDVIPQEINGFEKGEKIFTIYFTYPTNVWNNHVELVTGKDDISLETYKDFDSIFNIIFKKCENKEYEEIQKLLYKLMLINTIELSTIDESKYNCNIEYSQVATCNGDCMTVSNPQMPQLICIYLNNGDTFYFE